MNPSEPRIRHSVEAGVTAAAAALLVDFLVVLSGIAPSDATSRLADHLVGGASVPGSLPWWTAAALLLSAGAALSWKFTWIRQGRLSGRAAAAVVFIAWAGLHVLLAPASDSSIPWPLAAGGQVLGPALAYLVMLHCLVPAKIPAGPSRGRPDVSVPAGLKTWPLLSTGVRTRLTSRQDSLSSIDHGRNPPADLRR